MENALPAQSSALRRHPPAQTLTQAKSADVLGRGFHHLLGVGHHQCRPSTSLFPPPTAHTSVVVPPPRSNGLEERPTTEPGCGVRDRLPTEDAAGEPAVSSDSAGPSNPSPTPVPAPSFASLAPLPEVSASPTAPASVPQNQYVEYLAMSRNERGLDELHLRLDAGKLSQLGLSLVQVGDRRIEVSVRQGSLSDSALAQLGERLRERGLDVRFV